MNSIKLKKVGPIRELEMEIDNGINIVIGEQASGKSTLGKEIYFCKKIRDYFVEYLCSPDYFIYDSLSEQYLSFLKYLRTNYMESFGTTKHLPRGYSIKYNYSSNAFVDISLDEQNYAKFKLSRNLEAGIKDAFSAVMKIYNTRSSNEADVYESFLKKQLLREELSNHFRIVANDLFCEDGNVVYIPAGRSLLSVLSEQLDVVDVKGLDLPMRDFVQKIRNLKSRFGKKSNDVVADYVKMQKGQIKNQDVDMAIELMHQILRGEYISDSDGEKVFIDQKHWVKLLFSSSGQQEALWILNILFLSILEGRKTYFIIEEPEAHLFPIAQKAIMELIALVHNSNGSQMLITTHSPYVLTATNLLVYSGNVEGDSSGESVIERKMRLKRGVLKAYRFRTSKENSIRLITESETGLIDSSQIDEVSELINLDTDRLIKLEMSNDLQ
ncbi:MAG: AAA family ATPase [Clostridiales bacterium]|nr:AAA family ATPase [Clostridiales bacterium]